MPELEFMEEIIKRLEDAYEFLSRNKRNVGYSVSQEYIGMMNILWDAQTACERKHAAVKDRYSVIAGAFTE